MTLLQEKLPTFDRELAQSIFVARPPTEVFRALHEVTLGEMPLAVLLNKVRYAFAPQRETNNDQTFVDATTQGGWIPLGEVPDRELASGLVGRFWKNDSAIDRVTPEQFVAESPPDRAKIACDYVLEPVDGGTKLSLRTRILEPREEHAARRFKLYYALIRLGIPLVVASGLRAIRRHAEKARAQA